jgi:branched-chain amino acid transport system substrate-binding protein
VVSIVDINERRREMSKSIQKALLATAAAAMLGVTTAASAAAEVFVPLLAYRTGPYAPNGIPFGDGMLDYLKLVNTRDGGVNGVKIAFEECEFGYATDRGVECYERLKSKKPVVIFPFSTGVTFALTPKAAVDKIPLMTGGYGRSDSADGSVFEWNFPLLGTYYNAADIIIQHLTKLEKGSLKGKKITLVYHDSPYGKDPIPVLQAHAAAKGFDLKLQPVTHPGVEQGGTWLQVRMDKPDYVLLWGWGVMNSAAIKGAISVGYPRSKIYGVWWSAAEPDVAPAGAEAAGYNGLALQHSSENNAAVHQEILKHLYDKGQGSAPKKEDVGNVLYNRGVVTAMLAVEAIRTAQAKYGKGPVTGEQVRWGFENLNIDAAHIKALGFEGMLQPIKTSCRDHVGAHVARVHTWDGSKWNVSSDWYAADQAFIKTIVQPSAKKYAEEQKVKPRSC